MAKKNGPDHPARLRKIKKKKGHVMRREKIRNESGGMAPRQAARLLAFLAPTTTVSSQKIETTKATIESLRPIRGTIEGVTVGGARGPARGRDGSHACAERATAREERAVCIDGKMCALVRHLGATSA